MAKRSLFFSLLAHLLLAVLVLGLHGLLKRPAGAESTFVVEAPLGDVFVQEAASGKSGTEKVQAPAEAQAPGEPAAAAPGGPASLAPGLPDGEAQPIGSIQPEYPPLSRRLGEAGEVVVVVSVEADGSVSGAQVETSSGHERLDEAARRALLAAHFHPAAAEGKPRASSKRMRIEFRLESGRN